MKSLQNKCRWRFALPCAIALLAGCTDQGLYTQLSEQQANDMVALLRSADLAADKQGKEGRFSVLTSSGDFSRAVRTLNAQGYPREQFDSMGKIFKREGFVSSPLEEHARLVYALQQEIANTISNIDGVVTARVHLVVPERSPLADRPQPAAASVFIKHRPGLDMAAQVPQIKALVVNSLEGVPYDNVTVALFPAETPPADKSAVPRVRDPLEMTLVAGTVLGVFAFTIGGVLWWRRRDAAREEPVPPTALLRQRPETPRASAGQAFQAALRRAAGLR